PGGPHPEFRTGPVRPRPGHVRAAGQGRGGGRRGYERPPGLRALLLVGPQRRLVQAAVLRGVRPGRVLAHGLAAGGRCPRVLLRGRAAGTSVGPDTAAAPGRVRLGGRGPGRDPRGAEGRRIAGAAVGARGRPVGRAPPWTGLSTRRGTAAWSSPLSLRPRKPDGRYCGPGATRSMRPSPPPGRWPCANRAGRGWAGKLSCS